MRQSSSATKRSAFVGKVPEGSGEARKAGEKRAAWAWERRRGSGLGRNMIRRLRRLVYQGCLGRGGVSGGALGGKRGRERGGGGRTRGLLRDAAVDWRVRDARRVGARSA